ncbi:polysaccharide biosynthesis/export family protein [Adhaeribacter aquaticus]|uniref:polysaccharide biosynthesis/export family protein n=1 Tax=Adhaeribacter aquaticus TaxID=299567 RepID=UPI000415CB17|nr:polysaccharide biosynthesis/export family protein [Adhaeribacter aquaticus]
MKIRIIYFFILVFLSSCSKRNLTYLSNLQDNEKIQVTNAIEPKIQSGDLLAITITSLSPESNAIFNTGVIPTGGADGKSESSSSSKAKDGYLVDKFGMVTFPLIGQVKLAGLTKETAAKQLTDLLTKYAKEPIVDIRFLNFKITVLGEVTRPSTFNAPTEKINIFEALGQAGDMTTYGKRENVLIIREQEGLRTTHRLNLLDKKVFNSPYFYLQQNDIVYVEADQAKASMASTTRANIQFAVTIGTALVSIAGLLLSQLL